MSDILDAFAGEDEELAGEVNAAPVYISQKHKQDFTGRVEFCGFFVHENAESIKNGEQGFRLDMTIEEINGQAVGSEKTQGGYTDVELRVGDRVSVYIYASKVAVKKSQMKMNFRELCKMAACFTGERESDYFPKGRIGPAAIREVFGDGTEQVGKLVHVFADEIKANGYAKDISYSVVPESAPRAKKSSK